MFYFVFFLCICLNILVLYLTLASVYHKAAHGSKNSYLNFNDKHYNFRFVCLQCLPFA